MFKYIKYLPAVLIVMSLLSVTTQAESSYTCTAGKSELQMSDIPFVSDNKNWVSSDLLGLSAFYYVFLKGFILEGKGFDIAGQSFKLSISSLEKITLAGNLILNKNQLFGIKKINLNLKSLNCSVNKEQSSVSLILCESVIESFRLKINFYKNNEVLRSKVTLFGLDDNKNKLTINSAICENTLK